MACAIYFSKGCGLIEYLKYTQQIYVHRGQEVYAPLQEVWFHGNLLEELPADFGSLASLRKLSLAGNRLASLPESIAQLIELTELTLSGNLLEEVPACLGSLGRSLTCS